MMPRDPLAALLPLFVLIVAAAAALAVVRERLPSVGPASASRRLPARSCALLLAVLVYAATLWLLRAGRDQTVSLEVDMKVSRGNVAELRVNHFSAAPSWAQLVLNSRQTYRFSRLPKEISLIRLDPTDVAQAVISICAIRVMVGERTLRRFGPDEIRGWSAANLSSAGGDSGCVSFESASHDPILTTSTSVSAPGGPRWLSYISHRMLGPNFVSASFVLGFFLFLLGGLRSRTRPVEAMVVAAVAVLAYPVAWLVMRVPGPPPPVHTAVSMAAYLGYPKFHDHLAALAVLVCSIGVAWLGLRLAPAPIEDAEPAAQPPASRRAFLWIVHLAVLALLLAIFQPDLPAEARALTQRSFASQNWDEQNAWVWSYFIAAGLKPLRDFFFVYSGFYLHLKPFPAGQLAVWFQTTALVWFFYLAVFQLTRQRVRRSLALLGLFLLPLLLGVFAGWSRYLLAVDLLLWYFVVCESKGFRWGRHVPLGLVSGLVFFYEPTQFVYAAPGMLLHTLLLSVPARGTSVRLGHWARNLAATLGRHAVSAGLPMLAGFCVVAVWLASAGMLPDAVAYQMSMRAISEYSAWPSPVADWLAPLLRFESVFLLLFLLTALGAYRWFSARERTPPVAMALLALGASGFVCFQKQILRPHIMEQVQVYPYVGLLLYGLLVWPRRTALRSVVIGCFAAGLLAIGVDRSVVGSALRALVHSPQTMAGNWQVLAGRGPHVGALDGFSPARLPAFAEEQAVIRLLKERCGLEGGQAVFVLGDDPVFYVLLGQPGPYFINNFMGCPIWEQRKTVAWIARRRPRFVIWDPAESSFDGVPHIVRMPLVYRYVAQHYGPVAVSGRFQVLSLLPPGAAPEVSYWARMLGRTVDLGHLPRAARASDHPACRGPTDDCGDVLFVRFAAPGPPADHKASALLETRAGPMTVQFHLVRGARHYVINLERLWFWGLAGPESPRVTLQEDGAQIRIERRSRLASVLY